MGVLHSESQNVHYMFSECQLILIEFKGRTASTVSFVSWGKKQSKQQSHRYVLILVPVCKCLKYLNCCVWKKKIVCF